jgi:hypothetical protein
VSACSCQHHGTDEVIGDKIHGDLFVYHLGCLAPQDIHTHSGLDVSQEQLRHPPCAIKIDECLFRVSPVVDEGGDYGDGFCPEAWDAHREGYLS